MRKKAAGGLAGRIRGRASAAWRKSGARPRPRSAGCRGRGQSSGIDPPQPLAEYTARGEPQARPAFPSPLPRVSPFFPTWRNARAAGRRAGRDGRRRRRAGARPASRRMRPLADCTTSAERPHGARPVPAPPPPPPVPHGGAQGPGGGQSSRSARARPARTIAIYGLKRRAAACHGAPKSARCARATRSPASGTRQAAAARQGRSRRLAERATPRGSGPWAARGAAACAGRSRFRRRPSRRAAPSRATPRAGSASARARSGGGPKWPKGAVRDHPLRARGGGRRRRVRRGQAWNG